VPKECFLAGGVGLQRLERKFNQWVMKQIVEKVEEYRNGFLVEPYDKVTRWLVPVLCFALTDWPEGQSMSGMKAGASSSKRNCRCCLHPTIEFSDTANGCVYPRRQQRETEEMTEYWQKRLAAGERVIGAMERDQVAYSQFFEEMGLSKAELYTNIYGFHSFFPPDILHTVCQGTVKLLKTILLAFAGRCMLFAYNMHAPIIMQHASYLHCACNMHPSSCSMLLMCNVHATCTHRHALGMQHAYPISGIAPSVVSVLNWRLRNIPVVRNAVQRCMHYRAFNKGITGWGKWTADDHVALLQQMAFAVGYGSSIIRTQDDKHRKSFIGACINIREIYILLKKRSISETELSRLHRAAKSLGKNIQDAVSGLPMGEQDKFTLDRPLLHAVLHYRYCIRLLHICCMQFLHVACPLHAMPSCCMPVACIKHIIVVQHASNCRYYIRRYGCGLNFDTGTHETYHKIVVNQPYAADCHREDGMEDRLARDVNTRSLIKTVLDETIPDPAPRQRGMTLSRPHIGLHLISYLHTMAPNDGQAIYRCASRSHALREAAQGRFTIQQVISLQLNARCMNGACNYVIYVACKNAYRLHARCMLQVIHCMPVVLLAQVLERMNVYQKLEIDFGFEKILYIASANYLRKGPRFDCVEVDLGGTEPNHPAKLVCFVSSVRWQPLQEDKEDDEEGDPSEDIYAIVQYYDVLDWEHSILANPLCKLSDSSNEDNYHVISAKSIKWHAHMVPNFDAPLSGETFWDRVD
jgi:hypothetical protein